MKTISYPVPYRFVPVRAPQWSSLPIRSSRRNAPHEPRKRDRLPHMIDPCNPCKHTLEPQTESGVRHGTEPAQVQIPFEGFLRQLVHGNLFFEKGKVRRSLRRLL